MNKTLVAYFSVTGATAKVAANIAQATGGTLFEIEPVEPYTRKDINWRDPDSRANEEHNDSSILPPIKDKVVGMEDYNVIFLGFPIWWGVCPNIIKTFLDSYGLDHKTIIPFATSGGSGIGAAESDLKAICPSSVKWLPGRILNSHSNIKSWLAELGL